MGSNGLLDAAPLAKELVTCEGSESYTFTVGTLVTEFTMPQVATWSHFSDGYRDWYEGEDYGLLGKYQVNLGGEFTAGGALVIRCQWMDLSFWGHESAFLADEITVVWG